MVKKINLFLLNLILVLIAVFVDAPGSKADEIPPGKKVMQLGGVKIIVGEGTKVRRGGHLTVIENSDEYMYRRFKEMENRFIKVEKKTKKIEDDIVVLEREIIRIKSFLKIN